jgi:hypothetical protein
MPSTYLHQIIAVERGVVSDTEKHLKEIRRVLEIGGDQNPLVGISRTYRPRDEEGVQYPPEYRKVQITVAELLLSAQETLTRLFDLKFTREYANCTARADVIVEGVTLLEDVPAGYLLFLESQLTDLITKLIDKIPALNPAEDWHTDQALPNGVHATTARETTSRTRVPQVQVLYEATAAHPAQVRPYETEQIVGYWSQVKMSGELPVSQVQAIRARAVKMLEAVRYAREAANGMVITNPREAGEVVLSYVFGEVISD